MYVSINYWKTFGGWQTKNLNQNRYPFTLPLGLVVHVSWRSGENLLQCMSLLIIGKLSEVDKERTSIESSILSPWQPLLTCCCSFKSTRFHYHCLDNGILQTRSITRASYGMNRPHIKSFGRNSTPQQGSHTLFLNPVVSFGGIYHQTVHVATPTWNLVYCRLRLFEHYFHS